MKTENSKLALNAILQKTEKGIPSWFIHPMEHSIIERLADVNQGDYIRKPVDTYLAMQKKIAACMLDQWIPENPLTMGMHGYEKTEKGATTGVDNIVCDGILINSPEAVVQHMETVLFPHLRKLITEFDEKKTAENIVKNEKEIQNLIGMDILKVPYGYVRFPCLAYNIYGYANYFMAYALYPDIIEKHFSLQADFALKYNTAVLTAYKNGNLPLLSRLDHDMADSRGTLVNIESLDKIWFPHFEHCLKPLLESNIKLIWHCDGNLMEMLPRLLEVGLKGFQGFQYEDGMDYQKICKMKAKDGSDLIIIAGVSVTRTLPFGSPDDIKREMKWLVDNGPETGLFLGGSSSIAPGVPFKNITTLVDGLKHYQKYGRD